MIPVLYRDAHILVVDKPAGPHVHPTRLSRGETSLLDVLESQFECRLYPVHRLDRPVGGILLMAFGGRTAASLGMALQERRGFEKTYLAVVRGWMEDSGRMERPLRQSREKVEKEAITEWRVLARVEAPWPDGEFPHSRYSLLECHPVTGRFHQIRRHLSGEGHPVMGDVRHGDGGRNRIWQWETSIGGLMLRSVALSFIHPDSGEVISLGAEPDNDFLRACRILGWDEKLLTH